MSNTHTLILRKVLKVTPHKKFSHLTVAEKSYKLPFMPFDGMNLMLDEVFNPDDPESSPFIPRFFIPRTLKIKSVAWSSVEQAWVAWLEPRKGFTQEELDKMLEDEGLQCPEPNDDSFMSVGLYKLNQKMETYFKNLGWRVEKRITTEKVSDKMQYYHELDAVTVSVFAFKDDDV